MHCCRSEFEDWSLILVGDRKYGFRERICTIDIVYRLKGIDSGRQRIFMVMCKEFDANVAYISFHIILIREMKDRSVIGL